MEEKRKINKEVANKFKEDNGINLFIEASAKTGFNAKNVLNIIIIRFSLKQPKLFIKIIYNIKKELTSLYLKL